MECPVSGFINCRLNRAMVKLWIIVVINRFFL